MSEKNSGMQTIATNGEYGITVTGDSDGIHGCSVVGTRVTKSVSNDWKMHLQMQNLTKNNSPL